MQLLHKVCLKLKIDKLWGYISSEFIRLHWKSFRIMSAKETINYILKYQVSVARFGDGELHILAYGCPLKFQRADKELQRRLVEVSKLNMPECLLCLPDRINCVSKKDREQLPVFWQKALKQHLYMWTRTFSKSSIYGNTNLSRLTEGESEEEKRELVADIKRIWEGKDVVIVEGKYTRFGVGNNLLDNVASVTRILCPAESAFDKYEQILSCADRQAINKQMPLYLLALGPTATVLAVDLCRKGYQAIDIGHLDICFENLNRGGAQLIPGKYVNEIEGGNVVAECTDQKYLSEIAVIIDNDL